MLNWREMLGSKAACRQQEVKATGSELSPWAWLECIWNLKACLHGDPPSSNKATPSVSATLFGVHFLSNHHTWWSGCGQLLSLPTFMTKSIYRRAHLGLQIQRMGLHNCEEAWPPVPGMVAQAGSWVITPSATSMKQTGQTGSKMRLCNLKTCAQWQLYHLNLPKLPPTGDQVFKYQNLWGALSFIFWFKIQNSKKNYKITFQFGQERWLLGRKRFLWSKQDSTVHDGYKKLLRSDTALLTFHQSQKSYWYI